MKLLTLRRPSVLAAACTPVTHEFFVGHLAARTVPTFGPARMRAAGGYGTSGFSGSTDGTIAGKDIPVKNAQLTGDVRGVPPRGRPV